MYITLSAMAQHLTQTNTAHTVTDEQDFECGTIDVGNDVRVMVDAVINEVTIERAYLSVAVLYFDLDGMLPIFDQCLALAMRPVEDTQDTL